MSENKTMSGGPGISDELLIRWVQSLRRRRYYGKTVLCWENGQIVHVKTEEILKMSDFEAENLKNS